MIRVLAIGWMLAASGAVAHGDYVRVPLPLPAVVEANLPANVSGRDVVMDHGCYYYLYQGQVYPLTTLATGAGPYCPK